MGQFDKLGKLKDKFDSKSKKEDKAPEKDETPEWITKLVDGLRKDKPGDDDLKKAVEAEVAKNVPKDASDDERKKATEAAYKQVSKEMKKQAKDHPEDAGFLNDKSKLVEKGIGTALSGILGGKNPTDILKKKIKLPF
jgi:hypothetical protein